MQGRMKRSILILYLTLLFGLSSACLPIVAGSGEEGNKTATTEAIQPQFTPLPPFKEESISPGNMQAYSFLSSSGQELDYLLYLPDEYHERTAWPLIISLHGTKRTRHSVNDVLIMNPLNSIGPDSEFPFILVAPVSPTGDWKFYHESMDELLDTLPNPCQ